MSISGSTRRCLVEQHCRFVVLTGSDGCFKSVGSWLKPTVSSKPTLSVHGSSRQCWASQHYRLRAQTGNVEQDNTAGFLLTSSDGYDNTAGLLLTGDDGPFVFYCFIIYIFSWNRVSLYIRYVDDRSINIKHYKCYGYSSNVLIKISIPQNKKEIIR